MGVLKRALSLLLFLLQILLVIPRSSSQIPYACNTNNGNLSSFPFCNTALSIDDRVKDLVGRLTLDEKVQQLVNTAAGIPRLGVPSYEWWSEALHGVSNTGPGTKFGGSVPGAVSYPQVILTAASFNATLWNTIGQVVSTEARAMYNTGNSGLTFWSPNVNIYRDPRWGRGQETPGEDPILASKYAVNYVKGLQDTDNGNPNSLKVAACCKHHTAYDLDSWNGVDRFHFDAQVTQQDLSDTFEPPFQSCVQDGNVASVMCSYNKINGVPSCVDNELMVGAIRQKWGLNGYIVSDCDSVQVLYESMHYTNSPEDAVADAIIAGLNMNCGNYLARYTVKAVSEGKINETVVDVSLSYLYATLMRLGYFDGDPTTQEYGSLGPADVCTDEHRQLAVEAARQGIVLLKNDVNCLPLSPANIKTIAVIGPNANVTKTMIGNYAGVPCQYTTPLQGLLEYSTALYQPGCSDVACSSNGLIGSAVQAAQQADAVILVVGLDQTQEREGFDRTDLVLPGQQQNLVTEVAAAAKGPVVLVIMSGGPIDVSFAKNSSQIASILWVGYPGEAGGTAIAQVIFGDYNPGGRLPVTWYPQEFTKISMTDMNMRPNSATGYPGRTYRFYTGEAVYNFGDGLSYSDFSHSIMAAPTKINLALNGGKNCPAELQTKDLSGRLVCAAVHVDDLECESLSYDMQVDVVNTGARSGSQVVLIFAHPPASHPGAPKKQLVAFDRLHVETGSRQSVLFKINACEHLSTINEHGRKVVGVGSHALSVEDYKHEISVMIEDGHLK